MDRKYIFLIGLVGALVVILILFLLLGRKTTQTSSLNFVTYNDTKDLKDLVAAFETQNNVKVNVIKKDLASYELDSLNLISTGKIDVWGIPNNWLPKHHDKLSDYKSPAVKTAEENISGYKTLYPDVVTEENIINNKIYGFPLFYDPLVMFTNSGLRSKAGSAQNLTREQNDLLSKNPTHWDELAGQAPLITQLNGKIITQSATALGTNDLPSGPDILTLLMLQNGTLMTTDDKTQAIFHTAANLFGGPAFPGAKALEYYASFGDPEAKNYSFSSDSGEPTRAFANGKIAYYIDYLSKSADINLINPDFNYSVLSMPQVKETKNPINLVRYETFSVPNTSANQKLAWQFVRFLTDEQNAKKYASRAKQPVILKNLAEGAGDTNSKALATAASWYNPDAPETAKIFRTNIADVLAGRSAQTVLDGAAIQVTNLLTNIKD